MRRQGPSVLYIPNESADSLQRGFRCALAKLEEARLIGHASFYGLLQRIREGQGEDARRRVGHLIEQLKPDVVILDHTNGCGLRNEHFESWRRAGDFTLVYHEADPYGEVQHRLPGEAALAGRNADIVLVSGDSAFRRNFLRTGSKRVHWLPQGFDPQSFGVRQIEAEERTHDVVMIANKGASRFRFRAHPNARQRAEFFNLLSGEFEGRFAVYGSGWDGPSAEGPVSFWEQEKVLQSAWVSANWDHYASEAMYFSNRLPISLASGSIHFTTRHPGYGAYFGELVPFLHFGDSPSKLVTSIVAYLDRTSTDERIHASNMAREFAFARFRQDDLLVRMLGEAGVHLDQELVKDAWSLEVPMPTVY